MGLLVVNLVTQRANSLDLNPHIIAVLQNHFWTAHCPDPRASPGHDDRPSLQGCPLRQERDRLGDVKDHFTGCSSVTRLSIKGISCHTACLNPEQLLRYE